MTAQLIITMRQQLARRFAKDRSLLDVAALLAPIRSAELIGAAGFSMRLSIEQSDIPKLRRLLEADFVVEPDYAMRPLAGTRRTGRQAVAGQSGGAPTRSSNG